MAKNDPADQLLPQYLIWVRGTKHLKRGTQFIFKYHGDTDWSMGIVEEGISSTNYEHIVVHILGDLLTTKIKLDLTKVKDFKVVPLGSKKEVAVLLYGEI